MLDGIWVVNERINDDSFMGVFASPQDFWRYLFDHKHASAYMPTSKGSIFLECPDNKHIDWWVIYSLESFNYIDSYGNHCYGEAGETIFTIKRITPIRWPS